MRVRESNHALSIVLIVKQLGQIRHSFQWQEPPREGLMQLRAWPARLLVQPSSCCLAPSMSDGDKRNVPNREADVGQADKGKGWVRVPISDPRWVLTHKIQRGDPWPGIDHGRFIDPPRLHPGNSPPCASL